MKNNVLVFDLDDTLYKEIDFLKSAYKSISSFIETTYNTEGVYNYMLELYNHNENVFRELISKYHLDITLNDLLRMYRNHKPSLNLQTVVSDSLEDFYNENIFMGIITDGRLVTQLNKINSLGLNKWISIDNIIISETFGYSKPSLKCYQYFMDLYPGNHYTYIGDNTGKDFLAPNYLGWNTICLLDDGMNIHKQNFELEQKYLPKVIISSFTEINDIIFKN